MTRALEIIAPGLYTTIQDLGRIGFQDVGVPRSGPLDALSLRLANALVGNDPATPCLEMLLQGPTIKVAADAVRVALVGCSAKLEIRSPAPAPHPIPLPVRGERETLITRHIPAGQSVTLARDEVFRIGALGDSVCAYLAIEGGPDIPHVLGSASTYVRGAIGGFHGRRLQARDVLDLKLRAVDARPERMLAKPLDLRLEDPIRVVLGPQTDYFTEEAVRTLLTSEYVVSPRADRMGYRLEGAPLAHKAGYDIVSDGIVTGAVQVPGSRQPIVLMVDNQTTGGYPKIATVISADVPLVARRKPGRGIRFVAVDVEDAERLRKVQDAALAHEISAIAPI